MADLLNNVTSDRSFRALGARVTIKSTASINGFGVFPDGLSAPDAAAFRLGRFRTPLVPAKADQSLIVHNRIPAYAGMSGGISS
jgi:hypothetical protein